MTTHAHILNLLPVRRLCVIAFTALLCAGGHSCQKEEASVERRDAFDVCMRWNAHLLELDRFSEGYRPPVSARMFAYMGIAAWESALPGLPEASTCAKPYEGLDLPAWGASSIFVLPAALDAAYAVMVRHFFPHTTMIMKDASARLAERIQVDYLAKYPRSAVLASRQYGEAVAEAVYLWASTDPVGFQAFLFNHDRSYSIPSGPGLWRPSGDYPMPPLLPHWGKARTFTGHVGDIQIRPPSGFSEAPNSAFFAQALEVYSISHPLKEENRWIAEFWSDDFPGVTFSAASRWISVANQALDKARPDVAIALETWLKVGLALNDAGVNAWHGKYTFNLERPDTYIQRNIDPDWAPLHPPPAFPAYPSGHACFAGAAATVLGEMLGGEFALTDRSHAGRREFLGKPRTFRSFHEMAEENALSRILMGVHFRMDCEEGLRLGHAIGRKTAALQLRQKTALAQRK